MPAEAEVLLWQSLGCCCICCHRAGKISHNGVSSHGTRSQLLSTSVTGHGQAGIWVVVAAQTGAMSDSQGWFEIQSGGIADFQRGIPMLIIGIDARGKVVVHLRECKS